MDTIRIIQIFSILISTACLSYGRIPTVRLCGDEKCETIISLAKTTLHYNPPDSRMISFKGNLQCRVMSKSVGENSDLWEIEVQGRRGFAPKRMIMEQKILIKSADLIQVMDDSISEKELSTSIERADIEENVENGTISQNIVIIEPAAVKREIYKTGENEVEDKPKSDSEIENIRLEVIGVNDETIDEKQEKKGKVQVNGKQDPDNDPMISVQYQQNIAHEKSEQIEIELELEPEDNQDSKLELEQQAGITVQEHTESELNPGVRMIEMADEHQNNLVMVASNKNNNVLEKVNDDVEEIFSSNKDEKNEAQDLNKLDIANNVEMLNTLNDINNLEEFSNISKEQNPMDEIDAGELLGLKFIAESNSGNIEANGMQQNEENMFNADSVETQKLKEYVKFPLMNHKEDGEMEELHISQQDIQHDSEENNNNQRKVAEGANDMFSPEFNTEVVNENEKIEETNIVEQIWILLQETIALISGIFYSSEERSVLGSENKYREIIDGNDACQTNNENNIFPEKYLNDFLNKVVAMTDLIVLLILTGATILIYIFGKYFLANHHRETALISKLNVCERNLLTSQKEFLVTRTDMVEMREKVKSIVDKSFGADDLVAQHEMEKTVLHEQIICLEKELETAAEAGLELNKMVSELLNNQSGSESIITSVEELQHQLNEQEAATIYINNLLAEKSRENSELQVLLANTNKQFGEKIEELSNENNEIKMTNELYERKIQEHISLLESQHTQISRLKKEHDTLRKEYNELNSKYNTNTARVEALEETIRRLDHYNGSAEDVNSILQFTDANAKYLAKIKENKSLRDELDAETELRNHFQNQIKEITTELLQIRTKFNYTEKEKLEAQTRLEVLSNYFKEKESQLQKELSIKEELFMKQQGESTSTVDRVRSLQEDLQKSSSQNDELRAEIEAQSAAHKAQLNASDSKVHDSWLAAKQAERRFEEARSEASILRKKLTNLMSSTENTFSNLEINAPSPVRMESPSSPLMPPPPPIYNPAMSTMPFIPPPPLPLLLPNELAMRQPPLGRLMSPPPPLHIYETETDFSPVRLRERNYRHSPKGSGSDSEFSDDWDRQTY